MASKVPYAQKEILIPCDMCSKSESASSYCRECFIHICDNCKQQHLKHTFIPVLEGLLEKLHLVNCSKHQQRYTHYCITCKVNICEKCLDHRGHDIEIVGTQGKKLRNNFSEKIKSKKSDVTKIQDFMSRTTKHEQYFKDHSNKQIEKVWLEIRERKEMLDAEGEKIIETLELEQKEASEKLKIQSKELQDLHIELTSLTESLENQLSNIPDEAVLNFVNKNKTKLEENLPNLKFELPKPSQFTRDLKLLGSLSRDPPEQLYIKLGPSSLRQELEVVGKFKPTGSAVLSICATDDRMFWVGTSDGELLLVDKEGRTNLKVELPGDPWHTAITGSGDVIVSTWEHVIYKVTRQEKVIKFINVSPDTVCGVTSTQEGDVFAFVQKKSFDPCRVKKFSSEGKFLFELDSAMFKAPHALCWVHAVSDDAFCIQDGYPRLDADCYLTFVTASGQFESRVKRTGKLRDNTKSIVWDDHDNMLTATCYDEYIHVFSGEGVFKQSYKVGQSKRLWALCLGKDGVMWIGTSEGDVIIANYLQ